MVYSFFFFLAPWEKYEDYKGNKIAPESVIVNEDPYNSDGKHYMLYGNVIQRIDANSMLVEASAGAIYSNPLKSIVYFEEIPKGTSVVEGRTISIIVKGDGAFSYTTVSGSSKVVIKAI